MENSCLVVALITTVMATCRADSACIIFQNIVKVGQSTVKLFLSLQNSEICVAAVAETKWLWKQLVDRKPNRHACMHQLVISRLHFTSIFSHSTGSLGWHSGCCLLVIFPFSILLLGSLGWLSAPNGFRLLPGSLFLPLSLPVSLWLTPTLQPLLSLITCKMLWERIKLGQ